MRSKLQILLFSLVLIASTDSHNAEDLKNVTNSLIKTLGFMDKYSSRMNWDALLGITLAEAQIRYIQQTAKAEVQLLSNFASVAYKIKHTLRIKTYKEFLFNPLMNPNFWIPSIEPFARHRLLDLGVYKNWTKSTILEDKLAVYNGIPTDVCFVQVLDSFFSRHECQITPKCHEMMLAKRDDTGYLLTHRIMYALVLKALKCHQDETNLIQLCSLVLKEMHTNEALGFPQHDIFLEQMVFCGMCGFEEVLVPAYRKKTMEWLKLEDCFAPQDEEPHNYINHQVISRSSNVIAYDCTDHTSGLGLAALALNYNYILSHWQ